MWAARNAFLTAATGPTEIELDAFTQGTSNSGYPNPFYHFTTNTNVSVAIILGFYRGSGAALSYSFNGVATTQLFHYAPRDTCTIAYLLNPPIDSNGSNVVTSSGAEGITFCATFTNVNSLATVGLPFYSDPLYSPPTPEVADRKYLSVGYIRNYLGSTGSHLSTGEALTPLGAEDGNISAAVYLSEHSFDMYAATTYAAGTISLSK